MSSHAVPQLNPALQSIFARRSVRRYQAGEIPAALLDDLLAAGMAAPSAVARDPWHFIVLRQQDRLQALADCLPHGQMLHQGAAAIVVCGELARAHDGLESYLLQDLSAATENILLAASMLGLGGCWLGIHPRPERIAAVSRLCALPEGIIPVSGIALGWPEQAPQARTRFRTECVHDEQW